MKNKEQVFPAFLLVYHLLFAVLAWQYNLQNPSDAYRYWHFTGDWFSHFNVGTDLIKFFNYPFSKILQLPFWAGFVIHSLVGYYAILELYRWALKYISPKKNWNKYLLMLVFLLPNLHFWTSIIGKEPLVFLATTWIVIKCSENKYFSLKFALGSLLLILIRPHVAMFLLMAILLTTVWDSKKWNWKKSGLVIGGVLVVSGLYLMTMQLLNRNPFDLAYILERNKASLIAFKRAGSYVPMIDYNWFERILALNFQPLFETPFSWFSVILSVENLIVLMILMGALGVYIKNFRKMKLNKFAKLAWCFFIISSLFFIQRYSCLGIFVRTKIMYLPFLLIAALQIITQIKSPPRDQA